MAVLQRSELERSPLADLHAIASELGIEGFRRLRRDDLVDAIVGQAGGDGDASGGEPGGRAPRGGGRARAPRRSRAAAAPADSEEDGVTDENGGAAEPRPRRRRRGGRGGGAAADDASAADAAPEQAEEDDEEATGEPRTGTLDILPNGSGFLRSDAFSAARDDVYVSPAQIRRCELRAGDELSGPVRSPRRNERHPSLVRVDTVNGGPAEPPAERTHFDALTPVFATQRLSAPDVLSGAPFGRGSRVAIVDPPGAEATPLLRAVVSSLRQAHDDLAVSVVLVGARPEDATEWRREGGVPVAGGGFDLPLEDQTRAAEMALERAKRAVEGGRDVALVIDSLDALAPAVGRRVFGAARRAEEGGSLTVIATTGLSGELARGATTRIVLEPATGPRGDELPQVSPASDTTRGDLLT